ncbi:hypothetical protein PENANT_c028G05466 [Penicillium antarcticum]|uniref:Diphthine--ammonia ligase n=1 Tax=Penicillium antarcticum TaxID=416450 RepID=A0A1V6PW69_9EURO|nr:uncharacterized protein N7508_009064 [Penicillium antarcticum]KAJ5294243.1 hypothetical protein N7508_009064 [Penicillium antarcticum]OQD81264.1 hypothetical protein PENANT_c028G05466 [Penicillium antarcticum]
MAQPSPGLNVIALISGGKDSLYSILHCIRNGHQVVALANLYPEPSPSTTKADNANDEEEDIDSFMYQTIGHSIIPLYEEALGIPLYREAIKGNAVDTSRIYKNTTTTTSTSTSTPEEADETESLIPLLTRIKRAHPEANAVSAGAILSTYQRTRIENIAGRLGLTPLAWLWQYPILPAPEARIADPLAVAQAGLLEDMAAVGCDARIIKVASGGLDEGFLWEDVSGSANAGRRVRGRIGKAMGRFAGGEDVRGAVLGEGGEYETLALNGPDFLWKGRIGVDAVDVRVGEGGVAFARVVGARVEVKDGGDGVAPGDVRRPGLLDGVFEKALERDRDYEEGSEGASVVTGTSASSPEWTACEPVHRQTGSSWTISNIVAPEAGPGTGEQMKGIADKVVQALTTASPAESGTRSTDDIVFATVLLNSMGDFGSMNDVYVSLFNKPNPPARVTVACGDRLPSNVKVMVSFVVDLCARDLRQGLHVQSRSYWAPANIGPYSQAMSVPLQNNSRLVHIAGQIPLDPASMEMAQKEQSPFENYRLRAVLALQHLWRIGEATQVDWWLGVVAFLARGEQAAAQAQVAWRLWENMHALPNNEDEDDDEGPQLDAWDLKYGRRTEEVTSDAAALFLPKFTVLNSESATSIPPFLAVQVDELPRGSDIEWQGLGGRCEQVKLGTAEGPAYTTTMDGQYTYISIEVEAGLSDDAWDDRLNLAIKTHSQNPSLSQAVLYTSYSLSEAWPGQVVPCRSIWGRGGRKLGAGIILQQSH